MPEQASVVVKHLADVGLTELGLCFQLSNHKYFRNYLWTSRMNNNENVCQALILDILGLIAKVLDIMGLDILGIIRQNGLTPNKVT